MRAFKRYEIAAWGVISFFMGSTPLFSQIEFWKPITGIRGRYASTITSDTSGNVFVATDSGLFRSKDEGETWQSVDQGLPEFNSWETSIVSCLVTTANRNIFAGTLTHGVYRSSDNGESWTFVGLENSRIWALAANQKGHIFASYGGYYILRSVDDGENWIPFGSELDPHRAVPKLFVDHQDYIYATAVAVVGQDGILYRSTDDGETWIETGLRYLVTEAMAFKPDGSIFAGTSQPVLPPLEDETGIYYSTDHGDHWTRLTTDLVQSKHNIAFSIAVNSRGHLYAGGYSLGVYRSFDDGKSWEQINSGLSNLSIMALAFSRDGHLFAGTRGGGAFRSAASTTSVQAPPSEVARSYSLEQNFPNPANTHTNFSFVLPHPGQVSINIYNLVGEEVKTFTEKFFYPGRHIVQVRTDGLANGVYVLRMETSEFSATRKVLVIK